MRSARIIVFLLLVAIAFDARAQETAAYSRLGFGASGVALGNAVSAHSEASPWYNPALAPFATRQRLTASVGMLSFDRELQFIEFATPLQRAGLAAGLVHAGVQNIDGRDNSGFHTGMLSTSDFAGFLAFGVQFSERITGGIGLQLFRSDLYDGLAVTSIGVDFGITANVWRSARIAFVADDLLARYTWDTSSLFSEGGKSTTDPFPRRLRFGVAGSVRPDLEVMAEYEARFRRVDVTETRVELLASGPVALRSITELTLRNDLLRMGAVYRPMDAIDLRAGLDRVVGGEGAAFRPGLGFSVVQPVGAVAVQLSYTFAMEPHDAGSAHYIGLRLFLEP